jgi:GAF domain-containing protein
MPEDAAHPVLANPVVTQHVLSAVVLYGAHENSTLPDPDEVELLESLSRAAAASHQQLRIAKLLRETQVQRIRNEQLEASLRVLAGAAAREGTT